MQSVFKSNIVPPFALAEPARPVSWAQAEEANTFDLSSICKETPERVCEESYVCHFLEPFGESSVF